MATVPVPESVSGSPRSGRIGAGRAAAGKLRRGAEDRGIAAALIDQTPIAVVDVETTGLKAGDDRVVELCVVRLEPTCTGQWRRETVLSTLVNPGRAMGASHVHGITAEHVASAPSFGGISRELLGAISGAVVAGWNAHFDVRFLQAELAAIGLEVELPFVCSMRLRPMAGLGPAISLKRACAAHDIALEGHHSAEADTVATARLTELALVKIREKGAERFKDLRKLHGYSFVKSLRHHPMRGDEALFLPEQEPLLRRSDEQMPQAERGAST